MQKIKTLSPPKTLSSLNPEHLLDKLDLAKPGLEAAQKAKEAGNTIEALTHLRDYYRNKYPLQKQKIDEETIAMANRVTEHTFERPPYEPVNYGPEINWEWDPQKDIEWVATVYRFYWARPLSAAYAATQDDKYVHSFVELATDWIKKHPLEKHKKTHSVYTHWKGFAWLDIQTGRRATSICSAFRNLIHGESFTPEFLGILLASMYDHQIKTELIPMNRIHNKAIFEQRGVMNIAHTFSEFKDTTRWVELALERAEENFLAQTTTDGVQREWSFGYHMGVLNDALEIMDQANDLGVQVSDAYHDRLRLMYNYIFAVITPDMGCPMFGDAARHRRDQYSLEAKLKEATQRLNDPKYAARVDNLTQLPKQTSYAFKEGGMYVMRNAWDKDAIHLGLHCSPLAISAHDQPDNGTFELYAYGRWLMPDTGFYTYGNDPEKRAWHRQTAVHQTLTLDNKDSEDTGHHLLWHSDDHHDVLVVQNQSYENLVHRRTVWFVNRQFFVFLDEAIGDATGQLDLHFQFAPGDVNIVPTNNRAHTLFEDANVLVHTTATQPLTLTEEEGWYAWKYGFRKPRTACTFTHSQQAPVSFLSVVIPYRGTHVPSATIELPADHQTGTDQVSLQISAFDNIWTVDRDLKTGKASCIQQ